MSKDKESSSKKTITLEIDEKLWNRLVVQIDFLKELKIPELSGIQRPEDIIVFYIEQLTLSDQEHEKVNGEVTEVLKSFSHRGVNMRDLLNAFTFQKEEEETEENDDEDWEVEDEED